MRRKWLAGAVPLAVLLVFATQPAAAADTTTEALIDGLNQKLLIVAIPITILVEGILLYTVLRFRNADEPEPTRENRRLEITWTVATAIILLFVGFSAYSVLAQPAVTTTPQTADPGPNDAYVEVTAEAWAWNFEYPRHNVSSTGTLVLPKGQTTYLNITSTDWLHSFHAPGLALKQDAIPGQYNTIRTTATSTGVYQGYCAEYCGVGHSQMLFTIYVYEQQTYQKWVDCKQSGGDWSYEQKTCSGGGSSGGNSSSSSSRIAT